jgi:hypothetical protein
MCLSKFSNIASQVAQLYSADIGLLLGECWLNPGPLLEANQAGEHNKEKITENSIGRLKNL